MTKHDLLDDELENDEFRHEHLLGLYVETFLGSIEEAMDAQGVTRSELAKRMGYTPANITRIFSSDNPTTKTLILMADTLGLDCTPVLTKRDLDYTVPLGKPEFLRITGAAERRPNLSWNSNDVGNDNAFSAVA